MLNAPGEAFKKIPVFRLGAMDPRQIGVDDHRVEAALTKEIGDRLRARALREIDARKNAAMRIHHCRRCLHRIALQDAQPLAENGELGEQPLERRRTDEIAVDDQQRSTRFQDTQPFGESRLGIDQRPDQMPVGNHVIGVVRLHRVLCVSQAEVDSAFAGLCLGVGALHHRLRPVDARHPKAQIIHQMRNDTGAARKIKRGATIARADVPQKQLVPGGALFLRKDLVAGRLVEGGGPFRPVCLDFGAQVVVRQSFDIAHLHVPDLRASFVTSWNLSKR